MTMMVSTGLGQEWAKRMFDQTSHDFGTVARGAKVEHRFTLENIYEEDVHIVSVSSTCGCASSEFPTQNLKTWDKAQIVARVDTRGYYGRKDASLKVSFDKPFRAEVQLHIHTYIRRDVVVQPGVVQFGTVRQGTSSRKKVSVDYAGRSDWRIQRVECANPHLQAQVVQKPGVPGQVGYELLVTVSDTAPAGYIRDQLTLVTNDFDSHKARVPVPVEGVVVATLSVHPPSWSASMEVGQSLSKRFVVKGAEPFSVVSATCRDERLKCTVLGRTQQLYLITVDFAAGATPETLNETIFIETDLGGKQVLEVPVRIQVTPQGTTTF
ncbi:MAG: hypothetical protein A2V70_17845 [Planctomycetes bacterium RBG_13_63_9]|nr:MAG: hypothetical protein A2V70_17845 [Planctomycetes bacterium RBG_13_63_9]